MSTQPKLEVTRPFNGAASGLRWNSKTEYHDDIKTTRETSEDIASKQARQMHLLSINIGSARTLDNAKASTKTGIYKLPVDGPVQVTAAGLPGDAICSVKHHGGPDQAVYVYGGADYAWWSKERQLRGEKRV